MAIEIIEAPIYVERAQFERNKKALEMLLIASELGVGERIEDCLSRTDLGVMRAHLQSRSSDPYEVEITDVAGSEVAGLLSVSDDARRYGKIGRMRKAPQPEEFFYSDVQYPGLIQFEESRRSQKYMSGMAKFLLHVTTDYYDPIPFEIDGREMTAISGNNRLTVPNVKQMLELLPAKD